MQGLVVSLDRGYPLVRTARGEQRAQHAIELVKNVDMRAAVGDNVSVSEEPGQDMLFITSIQERRNILARRELVQSIHEGAGKIKEQVLAANFDFVAVVQSLGKKRLDLDYLERQLVMAHQSGTEVMVVLTKADLAKHFSEDYAAAREVAPGSTVLCLSKATIQESLAVTRGASQNARHAHKTEQGTRSCSDVLAARDQAAEFEMLAGRDQTALAELDAFNQLARYVQAGHIGVLIGRSGVGKSTLVNLLCDEELQATASVRKKDNAGRHTTVARRLVDVPGGGAIIDTPGMRAIGVLGDDLGLALTFPEITSLAQECRYRDCTHTHEPGCAVIAAVEAGSIAVRRLESYRTLAAEVFD